MTSSWVPVADSGEIEEGDTRLVALGSREICLYRITDGFYATDNKCTHGDADLADGLIQDDCLIECPLHEGTFEIRTGQAVGAPCTEALRCYPVKVEDGVVLLRLPEEAGDV